MEFLVLGPVEVRIDGKAVPLGGPKQRALLALLLLNANKPVSRSRLIDAVWGERAPASVERSLDNYVSRLRTLVGPDRLERRPPGYLLRVEPGELDLERFAALREQGRAAGAAGDPATARGRLRDALGGGPELIGELERLVSEHPFQQRLLGQLMLSLHRAGRPADALAAYQAFRRRFAEEVGLDPSAELRTLERRILEQDPTLGPAA